MLSVAHFECLATMHDHLEEGRQGHVLSHELWDCLKSSIVQIVVFGVAAFIVLVFVLSGVHFARAVYLNQLLQRERAARREMMVRV